MRKDETRKLLPQKLVLRPVAGSVTKARFFNPVQLNEVIGYTAQDFITNSLNEENAYDPYKKDIVGGTQYAKIIETQNYVSMTIQSGRYFIDANDGNEYLEMTVFDQGITNLGLLNESFTTVKITAPQGGTFVADRTQSLDSTNRIEWFGNSSGYGYLHAVLNVPGTNEWHLILKGVVGKIDYSQFDNIRFSQGAVFADLLADADFGKSLYIKDLIAKGYPEYYYRQNGAAVYTVTPGDIITDDANIQYYVESVTDAGELEDTFYIFDTEEIQRRIFGQQDGIYYLTAVRGNISPFPTGAGNQGNFRNFKFSQPISKLYPLNYKNDPLWFKQLDATEVDPPATYSAADNYTHGLVTVNDFKGSMTREMAIDFTSQPALSQNTYTQVSSTVDNRLRAQKGNASSGSEDRKIPIAGDSTVVTDQRLYVELRRPSIARAGNHTFEYLGFGPGNYSTGLPARQEIVLTPTQDFYAQSKKQDGGLVFYTGLNSNGDLYIGNRKIDAITGEEEFLESAQLVDSDDDTEDIGTLVTTFDTPVTFNEYITVNGGDAQDRPSTFNSPVVVNVLGRVRDYALQVISNVSPSDGDDPLLDKTQQFLNQDTNGDIIIARNRVSASIFQFNPRGSSGSAQGYKIQNHAVGSVGSNITPNQSPLYGTGLGTALNASQNVLYGTNVPLSGDILLKGSQVGRTGSLGWIYASFFQTIPSANILNVTMDGSTVITINWGNNLSNEQVGVTSGSQIRISNFSDSAFNGLWQVISSGFSNTATSCQIAIIENRGNVDNDNPRLWTTEVALGQGVAMEFSNSAWKEVGVLGAEALRTETDTIGDYKLGINTVARSAHDAYQTAFTDTATDPRANLDVVGTAFISGKTIADYLDHDAFSARTEDAEDNALLVGGNSASPNDEAVLRVATTNGGRVGINVTNAELDRALVVDGTSRFTDDARFEHDIEVNGDDGQLAEVRTSQTTGSVNLFTDTTFTGTLNIGNKVGTLTLLNTTPEDQFIYVGNASLHSNIWIGNTPDGATNISKVTIGGAYNNNESLSFTQIDTKALKTSGDMQLGTKRGLTDTVKLSSTAGTVEFFSGNSATSALDLATNASNIRVGGQGGSTTVRNNLIVDATLRVNSDITLCGGFASYSFTAFRAQMGSVAFEHATGILGGNLFNSNVDLVSVLRVDTNSDVYNALDTAGSGEWGSTDYQELITQIPGTVEPTELPALTGKQYYLPLKNSPYDSNGDQYFTENDILLLDTPATGSKHPEFLRIVSLPRISTAPYYIVVERQPFGTFTGLRSDHTDTSAIYKCNVQFDATWTEQFIDGTGTSSEKENIYLSQFGGELNLNDYIIVDREDGTPAGDGVDDQGEVFKIDTILDQIAKSFRIKNGCDTAQEEVVFEINSVTGDTIINSTTTNINGTLSLAGVCGTAGGAYPSPDPDLDDHLTIKNTDGTVWDVNMCNGDMLVGSTVGTVFAVGGYWSGTPLDHTSTSVVHGYRFDKQTLNQNGPVTTVTAGFVTNDWNIPVDDIENFQNGDLVLIYNGTTQGEIILITDDPFETNGQGYLPTIYNAQYPASEYPTGGRGAEGSGVQNWNAGAVAIKIRKYGYTTTLVDSIPASNRTIVESPNTNPNKIRVKLKDSRLVGNKLDTSHFFRIVTGGSQEWFWADSIDGNNSSFGVRLSKSVQSAAQAIAPIGEPQYTAYFGGGSTTFHDEVNIYGGEFRVWGSDGETLLLNISNDDDHPADGAVLDPKTGKNGLWIKGGGTFLDDLRVQTDTCEANGVCTNDDVFRVFNEQGNVNMGEQLYIKGKVVPTDVGDADVAILHIDNLGGAGTGGTVGPRDFKIYQDCSIDAFGISRYFTRNGGRRYTYVEQSLTGLGQTQANPLQPNNNYLLNNPSGTNMVLYLPDYAETGDMIRFVEVSGNLTYNTTLVLRALKVDNQAVAIQGDTSGSKIQAGTGQLITAWDSGEMIVQTRNASFGLIYVGPTDAAGDPNASSIPSNLRGWWLTEL